MKIALARHVILLLVIPALLLGPVSFAVGGGRATDAESSSAVGDNDQAIQNAIRSGRQVRVVVQLTEPSLATYTGGIPAVSEPPNPPRARNWTAQVAMLSAIFVSWPNGGLPSKLTSGVLLRAQLSSGSTTQY